MPLIHLAFAIAAEVFATTLLKKTEGFSKIIPTVVVLIAYGLAFYFLSLSLLTLPIGTAYAIWAGVGTAVTAVIAALVYQESFNRYKIVGIIAIIMGVVLLNLA